MLRSRERTLVAERLEDRRLLTSAPELVVDLNTSPASAPFGLQPRGLTDVEGTGFFFEFHRRPTPDLLSGNTELWKLDEGAASLVKQFRPPRDESFCCLPVAEASFQGRLFFMLQLPTRTELWSSDGSDAGTKLFLSFPAAVAGGFSPGPMTVVGDQLFFDGWNAETGQELWVTDGSVDGTRMVSDIAPGRQNSRRTQEFASGNTLFFLLDDRAWWRSDGTADGTGVVVESVARAAGIGIVGNELYYTTSVTEGLELRATDGSADRRVATFADISESLIVGDLIYLRANDKRLFVTDGTEQGTQLVRDFTNAGIDFGQFTTANGKLLFASSPTNQLWSSDGTRDGTAPLAPLSGFPHAMFGATAQLAWFTIGSEPANVWRTDGTAAGTFQLTNFETPAHLTAAGTPIGDELIFGFDDGDGAAIWLSDGTLEKTREVFQRYEANADAIDTEVYAFGEHVFFGAHGDGGDGYWTSDGTAEGTQLVLSRAPNVQVSGFSPQGNYMFFVVEDEVVGQELWVTDGVREARLVADVTPGPGGSDPRNIARVGDKFFFVANRSELWITDTTPEGTVLVTDRLTSISSVTDVGGTAYFAAAGDNQGVELWKSDGTAAGTVLVEDIAAGESSTFPQNLQAVGDTLFFSLTMFDGTQIWTSDGTARGTVAVATIPSEAVQATYQIDGTYVQVRSKSGGAEMWTSDGTDATQIADLEGHLYDSVQTSDGRITLVLRGLDRRLSLWVSDGTAEGTHAVHTLAAGNVAISLLADDDEVYYAVESRSANGGNYSIWVSDGTRGGSRIVTDLSAGGEELLLSAPRFAMNKLGDALVFPAVDAAHGHELRRVQAAATPVGDLDRDGIVGFADFLRFAQNFGKRYDLIYSEGDLNLDGEIDLADFIQLVRNYGATSPA